MPREQRNRKWSKTTTQTAVKSRKLNGKKTELQAQGARGKREHGVLGGGGAPPGWVVRHGSGVETEESPGWDSKKSRSWKGLRCQAEGLSVTQGGGEN